jgi:hypothetical protein
MYEFLEFENLNFSNDLEWRNNQINVVYPKKYETL